MFIINRDIRETVYYFLQLQVSKLYFLIREKSAAARSKNLVVDLCPEAELFAIKQ